MKTLKIEMIHDIVCSWCPIGYSNIQKAIANLGIEVDFHFLPFELNPQMPGEGEGIASYFKRLQGWNSATLLDYQTTLVTTAKNAGVIIDFSKRTHYYNTKNAHKLIHWAEQFNKQSAVNECLIKAYFEQGLDISNTQVLLDLVEPLGLSRSQAEQALNSAETHQQMQLKKRRVQQLDLSSVPAFMFNQDILVSGSNSVEYFEQAITAIIQQPSSKI